MSDNLERLCTVDISLASPIANNANFDTVLILGPEPASAPELPLVGVYRSLEELTELGVQATGEYADPVGVAARVAFSQSPRPHEVFVACKGRQIMDLTDKLKVLAPNNGTDLFGKKAADMIGEDVRIYADGTVVGTLKRVEEYTGFSSVASERQGNYIPLMLPAGGKKLTTTWSGKSKRTQNFPDNRILVARIPDAESTLKIEIDDKELITLDFSMAKIALLNESPDVVLPTVPCSVTDVLETALATTGWYCICPVGLNDDDVREVIQWTETQNKLCGYVENDIDEPIVDKGLYLRSFPCFVKESEKQVDVEVPVENKYGFAVAMAVKAMNYHAGEETWALKQLATVAPAKLSSTFSKKLDEGNYSYLITVASRNITQGGKTNGGEWIDVIRFRDWLQNDMQVRVVNLLVVNPKIPYTDNGIGLVENQMLASLKEGQKYGGIAPTEYDENGTAIPGYVTQVPLAAEITSTQKASRVLTDCRFSARLAGAIHMVEIKGCLTYENL